MALIRRNTSRERIEVHLPDRVRAAALGHLEPAAECRRKLRPGGGEARIDAARSPLLGSLANLVGREEPFRFGAGQGGLIGVGLAMGQADLRRIFICAPK